MGLVVKSLTGAISGELGAWGENLKLNSGWINLQRRGNREHPWRRGLIAEGKCN